ncbi:MAG: AAA family ATPase [Bradymonadales bacterium]|nr:AAA family ATPase [Bradymonadales bacterium]
MGQVKPLEPGALYRPCDVEQLDFQTTDDLEDLHDVVGQARAVESIQFGIGMRRRGYNLFVLGPPGAGKHAVVKEYLARKAATEPTPPDWCYVNNFKESAKPTVMKLPAGQGEVLRKEMEQLIEELQTTIPAAFESEDYRTRKQEMEEEFQEQHEKALAEVQRKAKERSIALIRTPAGLAFAPLKDGEVVAPEEFRKMTEQQRAQVEQDVGDLQLELQRVARTVPKWKRDTQQRIKELDREITKAAVANPIEELKKKFKELQVVQEYLEAVEQDIIDNADDFQKEEEALSPGIPGLPSLRLPSTVHFRRYRVNLLVNQQGVSGAPVVYEDYPTFSNLIGRVEHIAQFGALMTDFNLIRPGALHRANGGYLMLDARKVLTYPFAWEGLKRTLHSGFIRVESLEQMLSVVSTVSLQPEPIPLDVKIALVGDRFLYYLLYQLDPDFQELFRVATDFEDDLERNPGNDLLYARMIATRIRKSGLMPFDRQAVARIIEHGARLAGDAEKLTAQVRYIGEVIRETAYWAKEAGHQVATADDVERAIQAQRYRSGRLRERALEMVQKGVLLIDTEGDKTGQINGLSVIKLGQFAFGRPSRITCRVRLGKGEVVDIERKVELGGPLHTKGVLILSGFLSAHYLPDEPLSLWASLVFEQSYGGVEGDSASAAELFALLSAVAQVPIKQSLAVTGSVNQHGEIQAIGGVNEKIEGFFDLCQARGLNGHHGVLIPHANQQNLMLRREVVEAVEKGQFSIYAIRTVDEGMELLTGLTAGQRSARGRFPRNSLNHRVEKRLKAFAEARKEHEKGQKTGTGKRKGTSRKKKGSS